MTGKWHVLSGQVIVVLLLLATVVSLGLAESPPIRIGEVNPLTGRLAKHGIEIHEGIQFAVEQVNAAGGIAGRPVVLISRDDQSLPEVAMNQAEELLLREKVVGLVGGYVDSLVGPISQLAARYQVPYVASASLQRALTQGRPNPYFFRVSSMEGIVRPLGDFVLDVVRPTVVGILYAATPGATELSRELKTRFEQSRVKIGVFEKFRPGTPDFSSFLLKIRQAGVDVLIVNGFLPDHLILVRQLRELQVPLRAYLGPWGVAYPSFVKTMGVASNHLIGMCAWSPRITLPGTEEESGRLTEGFRARYGTDPNTTTMHGYTSARAMLAAIRSLLEVGRELTGTNLAQSLHHLDLRLPMERLRFDAAGDPLYYAQVLVQINEGEMRPIFPPQRAVATFVPMKTGE